MPISFGLTSNLSISQNLSVGGTAAIGSSLTLSDTTASSLLYGNASKVVSSVTLASNLSLTTGTLALAAALTGINSVTSVAGQNLVLALGTGGTALTLANSTLAATFAGNSIAMAGGSSWADSSGTATISGGSSGASLVLGSGGNGSAFVTPAGAGTFQVSAYGRFTGSGTVGGTGVGVEVGYNSGGVINSFNRTSAAYDTLRLDASRLDFFISGGQTARLTSTGNLLIGTTTDMTNTAGGLTVAATGSGATATGVNTGGLRSANFGLSTVSGGASYFGGAVTATGNAATTNAAIFVNDNGAGGTAQYYLQGGTTATTIWRMLRGNGAAGYEANGLNIDSFAGMQIKLNALGGSGGSFTVTGGASVFGGAVTATGASTTSSALNVVNDTGASGQHYIRFGTTGVALGRFQRPAASNAIELAVLDSATVSLNSLGGSGGVFTVTGGNATFAGAVSVASTTPSTGLGTGALQVAGGIYAGAASVFGGAVTINALSGVNALSAGTQLATFESSVNGAAVELITKGKNSSGTARQANIGINRFADDVWSLSNGTTEHLRVSLTTGAATFAGAVTLPSATIANGTGTKKLLFYNASSGSSTISLSDDSTEVAVQTFTKSGANVTTAFGGVTILKNYTVATLPAAASYTYGTAFVSDATNAAGTGGGTAPTGGGAVKRLVYSDGTNWLLQ